MGLPVLLIVENIALVSLVANAEENEQFTDENAHIKQERRSNRIELVICHFGRISLEGEP